MSELPDYVSGVDPGPDKLWPEPGDNLGMPDFTSDFAGVGSQIRKPGFYW